MAWLSLNCMDHESMKFVRFIIMVLATTGTAIPMSWYVSFFTGSGFGEERSIAFEMPSLLILCLSIRYRRAKTVPMVTPATAAAAA